MVSKIIVLSTNNDNNKEGLNSGFCSAIKNYLILSQFFSTDKLFICLPTKNDFGDMRDEDFTEWERKLASCINEDQAEDVLNYIKFFKSQHFFIHYSGIYW